MRADGANAAFAHQLDSLIRGAGFIDLSPVLQPNLHRWHEHPDAAIVPDARTHEKHGYYLQLLVMPEHVGSHVDAPAHSLPDRMDRTIEHMPVDGLMAPGKLVDATPLDLQPGDLLTLQAFAALAREQGVAVQSGDIVLVRFGWDRYLDDAAHNAPGVFDWWGGNEPGFAEDLCAHLADLGVRAVGTDTAACDLAVKDGVIIAGFGHGTYFLPRDILIIEGLTGLDQLPPVFYFLAAPLRIAQGSGSPIRALALVSRGVEADHTA